MAGLYIMRHRGGACLVEDVIEDHIPEVGKPLPEAYCEGSGEVVIGVFDTTTQAGKLLGIIRQLNDFDPESNSLYVDALMDIVRAVGPHDREAAKTQGG